MRSSRHGNTARMPVRVAVLVGTATVVIACGASAAPRVQSEDTTTCVTTATTVPGDVFCDGYDPVLERVPDDSSSDPTIECPFDPLPTNGRPDDGWLSAMPSNTTQQLRSFADPQPAPNHPDRIRLVEAATAALPAGFDLVVSEATGDGRCPDTPLVISASFVSDADEEIVILWTHLRAQIDWFNEPLLGDVERSVLDDGTEIVANDFEGLGQKHRVWAARPDGSVVKVIVAGANAPSQAGWPTTTTRFDDTPDAQPAPLTLAQTADLALELLD